MKILKFLLGIFCFILEFIPALIIVYFKRVKITAYVIDNMLNKNDEDVLEIIKNRKIFV